MNPAETAAEVRPTSELVIDAIADHADVDPLEFDVPLGEVVDPDALDALFDSQFDEPRQRGRVEFVYQQYCVTVVSDPAGVSVELTPIEEVTGTDSAVGRQSA